MVVVALQATTYHQCDRYIEVDVDVASTPAVSYIVKMVQGATRSMLIDHAYLLESHFAHELPETLIGAIRCVCCAPLLSSCVRHCLLACKPGAVSSAACYLLMLRP